MWCQYAPGIHHVIARMRDGLALEDAGDSHFRCVTVSMPGQQLLCRVHRVQGQCPEPPRFLAPSRRAARVWMPEPQPMSQEATARQSVDPQQLWPQSFRRVVDLGTAQARGETSPVSPELEMRFDPGQVRHASHRRGSPRGSRPNIVRTPAWKTSTARGDPIFGGTGFVPHYRIASRTTGGRPSGRSTSVRAPNRPQS